MIDSRSHVGVYHYFRGFSIEKLSDFADAMNLEIEKTVPRFQLCIQLLNREGFCSDKLQVYCTW